MSAAATLGTTTLDAIVTRLSLSEKYGPDGGPARTLASPMSPTPVGQMRLFAGGPVSKLVYIGLTVPPIGLDSHMLFAFTAADSPIPHFTLDSVLAGPHFAFHCDLIPRVDLGANLAYINAALNPLTEHFDTTRAIDGLEAAHLSPRQYALMSPWMLAYRASESAFDAIRVPVQAYLNHWFGLLEAGLPAAATAGVSTAALRTRDERNRAAVFSKDVDPVWNQVARLVGDDVSEQLRAELYTL